MPDAPGLAPVIAGGIRPDTCTCPEHPVPHWHCRWTGDGGWHCPQQPHIHLIPREDGALW